MSPLEVKKRVLVVDDEDAILRIIGTSLRLISYDVVTCNSGMEALKLSETENPDIILLDVYMPGMNGLQVLEILRKTSEIPVIVFSALNSSREAALRLGAADFVVKPFTPDQIAKRIAAVLGQNKG